MQINNIPSSQINPVRIEQKEINIKDVEGFVLSKFTSLDSKFYGLFEKYKIKNNSNFLKDFLESYKSLLVEKNSKETEVVSLISKIFKTIEIQINLLSDLPIEGSNNIENNLIATALVTSFFRKNFID